MMTPHRVHTVCGFGALSLTGTAPPLPSYRRRCVRRVPGARTRALSLVEASVSANHSTIGATSLLQVCAVPASLIVVSDINRQQPSRSSKNQDRLSGLDFSQSRTYASTVGLIGS